LSQDWDMTEKEFVEALVRLCSAREAAWADVADLAAKFELFVHDVLELLIAGRCRRVRALSRPPRMLADRLRVEASGSGVGLQVDCQGHASTAPRRSEGSTPPIESAFGGAPVEPAIPH
jgi:hypothetical protein